jgi:hypothetical protein
LDSIERESPQQMEETQPAVRCTRKRSVLAA